MSKLSARKSLKESQIDDDMGDDQPSAPRNLAQDLEQAASVELTDPEENSPVAPSPTTTDAAPAQLRSAIKSTKSAANGSPSREIRIGDESLSSLSPLNGTFSQSADQAAEIRSARKSRRSIQTAPSPLDPTISEVPLATASPQADPVVTTRASRKRKHVDIDEIPVPQVMEGTLRFTSDFDVTDEIVQDLAQVDIRCLSREDQNGICHEFLVTRTPVKRTVSTMWIMASGGMLIDGVKLLEHRNKWKMFPPLEQMPQFEVKPSPDDGQPRTAAQRSSSSKLFDVAARTLLLGDATSDATDDSPQVTFFADVLKPDLLAQFMVMQGALFTTDRRNADIVLVDSSQPHRKGEPRPVPCKWATDSLSQFQLLPLPPLPTDPAVEIEF